jgi:hypothetical protein
VQHPPPPQSRDDAVSNNRRICVIDHRDKMEARLATALYQHWGPHSFPSSRYCALFLSSRPLGRNADRVHPCCAGVRNTHTCSCISISPYVSVSGSLIIYCNSHTILPSRCLLDYEQCQIHPINTQITTTITRTLCIL